MIHKNNLLGKYVLYIDIDGKLRTEKVIKVIGNRLTVINGIDERTRIWNGKISYKTGMKIKILGRVTPKTKVAEAEPIEWNLRGKHGKKQS